jgi:hypothetical protein
VTRFLNDSKLEGLREVAALESPFHAGFQELKNHGILIEQELVNQRVFGKSKISRWRMKKLKKTAVGRSVEVPPLGAFDSKLESSRGPYVLEKTPGREKGPQQQPNLSIRGTTGRKDAGEEAKSEDDQKERGTHSVPSG